MKKHPVRQMYALNAITNFVATDLMASTRIGAQSTNL